MKIHILLELKRILLVMTSHGFEQLLTEEKTTKNLFPHLEHFLS